MISYFTTYQRNTIIKDLFNRQNDVMLQDGEFLSNCLKYTCKHPQHNNQKPIENDGYYLYTEDSFLLCTEDNKIIKIEI